MKSIQSKLNPVRGARAAVGFALFGAIAPIVFMVVFTLVHWGIGNASRIDWRGDIRQLEGGLLGPVIGCALVFACAGWATFAPRGSYRFARSLVLILVISLPLGWFLGSLEITPRRFKGIRHPLLYFSELLVLVVPPIVAATFVTAFRVSELPDKVPSVDEWDEVLFDRSAGPHKL
jgi:hypothetical protein